MAKIYGETHFRHHRYPATDASIEVSCFDAGDGASDEYQRYAVVVVHTGAARLQFYARHGELRALAAHMLAAANDLDSGTGAVADLPPQSAASQAAPELLEALRALYISDNPETRSQALRAIAKAEAA